MHLDEEFKQFQKENLALLYPRNKSFLQFLNSTTTIDVGNFGEMGVAYLRDATCSGTSGGCSFDNSKNDEVKTVSYVTQKKSCQNKKCTECINKKSFSYTLDLCNACNHPLIQSKDARAGISAKSHFQYYSELGNYYIVTLNESQGTLEYKIYCIKKDNKFLNHLLSIQKDEGKDTKNLLPTSWEFFMCAPCLVYHAKYQANTGSYNVVKHVAKLEWDSESVLPIYYCDFTKDTQNKMSNKGIYDGYNPYKNENNIVPDVGNHGKSRGLVTRKKHV